VSCGVVGRDSDDLGVGDGYLRIVRGEQVLPVLLRAVIAPLSLRTVLV
jgi:hypothetical protein